MIPLSWLLLAWLILVVIHLLLSAITLMVHVRYGMTGFTTYLTSLVFIGMILFVLLITGTYFLTVDWNQTFSLLPGFSITPDVLY